MSNCPCGSAGAYADCCEPIITGARAASTAEELMRARYTAHVKAAVDFLFESTHPDHREGYDHEGTRRWAEESEWHGLEVIAASDERGEVEFVARFRDKSGIRAHHEIGHFERHQGKWHFTEGTMVKPKPLSSVKVGRNDRCPCGSGSKYKNCCGR